MAGITPSYGATLAEAGAVCFEDQQHTNGIELPIDGTFQAMYKVFWQPVTSQMGRCYNDEEDATELGAYAVALLLAPDLTGYTIVDTHGHSPWHFTVQASLDLNPVPLATLHTQ